jgi:hypothetical protein
MRPGLRESRIALLASPSEHQIDALVQASLDERWIVKIENVEQVVQSEVRRSSIHLSWSRRQGQQLREHLFL